MPQPPSSYPEPESRPLLHAVGVLLKGPLGVVLALLMGVGALALADGTGADAGGDVRVPEPSEPAPERAPAGAPQANLWVDSDVVGATVVVGGDTAGVAPVWVRGIAPGLVRVAVSSRGFRRDTTVYVGDGDDLDLSVRLGPAAQRAAARARLPPPPTDEADDEPDPETQEPDGGDAPPVAQGEDAAPVQGQSPPQAQRPPQVRPQPTQRERGRLRVSAPPGTALFIDGQFRTRIDDGPVNVPLVPGEYTVRVIYPSLALEETTVYVGRTIVVSLSFGPDPRG